MDIITYFDIGCNLRMTCCKSEIKVFKTFYMCFHLSNCSPWSNQASRLLVGWLRVSSFVNIGKNL